jgi:iron complex transport system ATP-binding protein
MENGSVSLLEAQNVTCRYDQRTVLESLTLSIRQGEVLGLLGPNGAGKTTLLRALARQLRPQAGVVEFLGKDLWSVRRDEAARHIALMPQHERRDWPLSVEDAVLLGRLPHCGTLRPYSDVDRRIVESALESTNLSQLRDRPITELSGGEWRRMAFARALAQEADILLLDEPTSGLDLRFQHEVLRLTRGLTRSRKLSAAISLHDINQASLYCDRLAILAEHGLLGLGTPREILSAEIIERAYRVPTKVIDHPVYGTPMVVPLLEQDHDETSGEKRGS